MFHVCARLYVSCLTRGKEPPFSPIESNTQAFLHAHSLDHKHVARSARAWNNLYFKAFAWGWINYISRGVNREVNKTVSCPRPSEREEPRTGSLTWSVFIEWGAFYVTLSKSDSGLVHLCTFHMCQRYEYHCSHYAGFQQESTASYHCAIMFSFFFRMSGGQSWVPVMPVTLPTACLLVCTS